MKSTKLLLLALLPTLSFAEPAVQCTALCLAVVPDSQSGQGLGELSSDPFPAADKKDAWKQLKARCERRAYRAGYPSYSALLVKSIRSIDASEYARHVSESSHASASSASTQFNQEVTSFRKAKGSRLKLKDYSASSTWSSTESEAWSTSSYRSDRERLRTLSIEIESAHSRDPEICEPMDASPEDFVPEYTGNAPVLG